MGCKCVKGVVVRDHHHRFKGGRGEEGGASPSEKIDVRDVYRIGRLLGSGAFGQVRECMKRETRDVFAMKIMEKRSSDKGHWSNENMFRREIEVLEMLDHPHIIKYYAFFEDKHFLYAVMEKCEGGELFEAILRMKTFPEERAAVLCYQMLTALEYLHSRNVVHRDIKAENFLFKDVSASSQLKLIDFGMSAKLKQGQMLTDVCGSPHYLSPELIKRKYDCKADVWALGVLIYLMLFGRYPFDGPNTNSIVKIILNKKIDWESSEVTPSDLAIHFLKSLLQRNPEKRPTAAAAAKHNWLAAARKQASMVVETNDDIMNNSFSPLASTRSPPTAATNLYSESFSPTAAYSNLIVNVVSAYKKLIEEKPPIPPRVTQKREILLQRLEARWRKRRKLDQLPNPQRKGDDQQRMMVTTKSCPPPFSGRDSMALWRGSLKVAPQNEIENLDSVSSSSSSSSLSTLPEEGHAQMVAQLLSSKQPIATTLLGKTRGRIPPPLMDSLV